MATVSDFTASLLPASTAAMIQQLLNGTSTSTSSGTGGSTQTDFLKGSPLQGLIDAYKKSKAAATSGTGTSGTTTATAATFSSRPSAAGTATPGPEKIDSRGTVPDSTSLLAFKNTVDFTQFKQAAFVSFVQGSTDLGDPSRLNAAYNAIVQKYGATVLLGYDSNANGKIDNESELFGFDDGDATTTELGRLTQFAPGVGTLGGYNAVGATTETANQTGVQQVDRITFGTDALGAGDQYKIGIGGSFVGTYTVATGDTTTNVIDNLVTQINGAGAGVTAINDSGTLKLTADVAGTGFATTAYGIDQGETSITSPINDANIAGGGDYGRLMFLTAAGQSYNVASFYTGVLAGISTIAEMRFNYDAQSAGTGSQFQVNLIL